MKKQAIFTHVYERFDRGVNGAFSRKRARSRYAPALRAGIIDGDGVCLSSKV